MGLYSGGLYTGEEDLYLGRKEHFNLQFVKLFTFLCFPVYSSYFGIFHVVQYEKHVQSKQ